VSALKLLDAGFSKQTMALMAVFQAPVSLVSSVIAGRLAVQSGPVRPYAAGFALRAVMSFSGPALVWYFRKLGGVITPLFYVLLLSSTIVYSIGSDFMFVCVSAFFLGIGDKDIGGSYLTLLATCSNLGGMWPKSAALFLVDRLSTSYSDGYYVLSFALLPVMAVTGMFVYSSLTRLLALPTSAWRGQQ
jgi:MFS transporter, PAT family, solute carrier family 33 (acetyl-CoA transportor), member 1